MSLGGLDGTGNADTLGSELLESLLKMAPTKEEERKLKDLTEASPFKLGTAETFLKAMLDIPFAFQRVDAMLYVASFELEVEYLNRSFETLEVNQAISSVTVMKLSGLVLFKLLLLHFKDHLMLNLLHYQIGHLPNNANVLFIIDLGK